MKRSIRQILIVLSGLTLWTLLPGPINAQQNNAGSNTTQQGKQQRKHKPKKGAGKASQGKTGKGTKVGKATKPKKGTKNQGGSVAQAAVTPASNGKYKPLNVQAKSVPTAYIGSGYTGAPGQFTANANGHFGFNSPNLTVTSLGVNADGDKVRGLQMTYSDGSTKSAGDIGDGQHLTTYNFDAGETLKAITLYDSGYGYGSVRRIELKTSKTKSGKNSWIVGPSGYDHKVDLKVDGTLLKGFYGVRNPDNFINLLGFWVTIPIKSVTASELQYDLKHVTKSAPQEIDVDTLDLDNRKGAGSQQISQTKDITYTDSSNWSSTWGTSSSISASVTAGVPEIASATLTVSEENSYNFTSGGSYERKVTTSYTAQDFVPVGVRERCKIFRVVQKISVPYRCTITVAFADGSRQTVPAFQGLYEGTTSTVKATYTKVGGNKAGGNKVGGNQAGNSRNKAGSKKNNQTALKQN